MCRQHCIDFAKMTEAGQKQCEEKSAVPGFKAGKPPLAPEDIVNRPVLAEDPVEAFSGKLADFEARGGRRLVLHPQGPERLGSVPHGPELLRAGCKLTPISAAICFRAAMQFSVAG